MDFCRWITLNLGSENMMILVPGPKKSGGGRNENREREGPKGDEL